MDRTSGRPASRRLRVHHKGTKDTKRTQRLLCLLRASKTMRKAGAEEENSTAFLPVFLASLFILLGSLSVLCAFVVNSTLSTGPRRGRSRSGSCRPRRV